MARLWISLLCWGCLLVPATAAEPTKVLRYAFRTAETSFDPVAVTDLYSRYVICNIFDAPLEYEFLARPARLRPNTLAQMPDVAADFKTFTFTLRAGIFFADDPAFGGRRRELTAADYVYALKRHYDPRGKSGNLYLLEQAQLLGLSELRRASQASGRPFDYDREVEGAKVLDRYRFQIRSAVPNPRLLYLFADPSVTGAVAREVVEAYGEQIGAHPVGTGPFRLTRWVRSLRIELERNPGYREVRYDEHPAADDRRRQAIAARFKGRRLPMVDRVEVSIIEESQPRWLSFLNGDHDLIEEVPNEFTESALPGNQLAPYLDRRGVTMVRYPRADVWMSFFNMEDPVVGGYTPAQVALRRAIALAVDVHGEIRRVRRGQAIPAQSVVGPQTWGYDPGFRSEMGEFDRAKARALLDLYGFVDRDGDGWRERPDGSPLELVYNSQPDQFYRQINEEWRKNMQAIGVRMRFKLAQWAENLKTSRAGKLMMWGFGWSVSDPDAGGFLVLGHGPSKGQSNHARFDLPAFNALYERQLTLPDGPERAQLIDSAKALMIAYMPYKAHVHRVFTDLAQPWVLGYDRNVFVRQFWKYVDVDPQAQPATSAR